NIIKNTQGACFYSVKSEVASNTNNSLFFQFYDMLTSALNQ
ncbi:MAG: hypothetical protein ACI9RZ_002204, partial [Sphingobacteriales bacterium]